LVGLQVKNVLVAFGFALFFLVSIVVFNANTTYALTLDGDWPMFHHDASNAGFTNSSAPVTMPQRAWSYGNKSNYQQFIVSPAVANGIVYVANVNLFAFNASTGEQLWWKFDKGYSSPVVENDIVYTVRGAFDAYTGEQLWSINGTWFVAAVANGYYYTNFRDSPDGGYDLSAFNATTGELIWKSTGLTTVAPAIANDKLFVAGVVALDAYTGQRIWSSEAIAGSELSPAFYDNFVFASGASGRVFCMNASSGKTVWNQTIASLAYPTAPAVGYGCVYVGFDDGTVYAFDAYTGVKKWNCTLAAGVGDDVRSSPVLANGAVYVGADDGRLYALNATTGDILWSYRLEGYRFDVPQHIRCSPAIANDYVYMGSDNVFLMALEDSPVADKQTGTEMFYTALFVLLIVVVSIVCFLFLKKRR
jgi:outer membrane protein assembly factor BamB